MRRGGINTTVGQFETAEEAALCFARTPEGHAVAAAVVAAALAPAPPLMTAEEALRQAEAEGLTLLRSDKGSSVTGYKGVMYHPARARACAQHVVHSVVHALPSRLLYQAQVQRGGRSIYVGVYATPEEAALVLARTPEGRAAAAAAAAAAAEPPQPSLTAEEAVAQAEAEGLTLLRSSSSNSGYRGVHRSMERVAVLAVPRLYTARAALTASEGLGLLPWRCSPHCRGSAQRLR